MFIDYGLVIHIGHSRKPADTKPNNWRCGFESFLPLPSSQLRQRRKFFDYHSGIGNPSFHSGDQQSTSASTASRTTSEQKSKLNNVDRCVKPTQYPHKKIRLRHWRRLLLDKLSQTKFDRLVNHVAPIDPTKIKLVDFIVILKNLFLDKISLTRRRIEILNYRYDKAMPISGHIDRINRFASDFERTELTYNNLRILLFL